MERLHDRPFQDFVAHETHRLILSGHLYQVINSLAARRLSELGAATFLHVKFVGIAA